MCWQTDGESGARAITHPAEPHSATLLGGRIRTCPRFFSSSSAMCGRSIGAGGQLAGSSQFPVSAPRSGASCFMVGVPGVAAERAPQGDSDSQGRAEVHSLGFFLGLDRRCRPGHSLAHRFGRGGTVHFPCGVIPVSEKPVPFLPGGRAFSFPPSEENAGFRPRNATKGSGRLKRC